MRRVAIYMFFDPQGIVDDYVLYKLRKLREHVETIFVVANLPLAAEGRERLEGVADTVYTRTNVGFDVGAYKDAMAVLGRERLAEYDELLLLNYTFFGPVFPFGEMFDRMTAANVDFWGVTAHKAIRPNPHPDAVDTSELPFHIQSTWLAISHRMFTSAEFAEYWDTMPVITSYEQSVLQHEARFTKHFAERGFRYAVAFPPEHYPSDNASLENAALLLDDRCPMVKRRLFFHEPTYMERQAIIGRRTLERIERSEYPTDLVWQNVVRSAEPRTLYTNFSLLHILGDTDDVPVPEPTPRVAVIAHIYYPEMVDEIMGYLRNIPVPYHLYVTTSDQGRREDIEARLARHDVARVEVRVSGSNRGRDMSAFLIACRDVLLSDEYDLVCKVHSKKSPQDGYNAAMLFKHHLFDNLLGSRGYVTRVLQMFAEQPTLGAVFPPVVNIGYPTLGHAWFTNREPALAWAKRLGIQTVFDRSTPVAPLGSMFWFRPQAVRKLAEYPFRYEDYPEEGGYGDGGLPHVQERLLGYAAMSEGMHVRSVLNADWASINYTFLEYRLQRVSSHLPGYTQEQVDYLEQAQAAAENPLAGIKRHLHWRSPRLAAALRPLYVVARGAYRRSRALTGAGR
ncbi:rhamnan synthesis F family protein [Cellulomonas aerilata]|uniref:LPS biosynthesis protein n=1 Tax=Cellulomonas aerilata TaxID=515326 RepID=A0A512DDC1_9CELL|nr:rhamnan synthesis F family protein [Cellulomonas aerilata]GEO34465.1 LPS biosynthesis protein [Cellulomonas aerilata]